MKKRHFIHVFVVLACFVKRCNDKLVYGFPFIGYHELIRLVNLKGCDRRINIHLTHRNAHFLRRCRRWCCSTTTPSRVFTTCTKQRGQTKEEKTENKGTELLHRSIFLSCVTHLVRTLDS